MSNNPAGEAGTLPDSVSLSPALPHGAVSMNQGRPVYDERDRLVILTPCYDWSCTTIWQASMDACRFGPVAQFRLADGTIHVLPIVAGFRTLASESHIDRGRNTLAWIFEQDPWNFGLWMDADQQFTPDHIRRLWLHLVHGHMVVGGCVAFKSIVPRFVTNIVKGSVPDSEGLVDVHEIGTGCLAFHRSVLERFRHRWPDIAYVTPQPSVYAGRTMHAYFASGVVQEATGRNWLPEDWTFCRRCHDLGISVKADVGVNIRHMGRMLFPAEPAEAIEAALAYCSGKRPPFNPSLAEKARVALKSLHDDINNQSITVLHATRRPIKALATSSLYLSRAKGRIDYIFAIDDDDRESLEVFHDNPGLRYVIAEAGGNGIVRAVNEAAARATGRILVMAADDCEPPDGWDDLIREALAGQLHEPRLLWTADGYTNQPVITHPIMTRALYEAQGYFFCPEYPHLFCDTELTVRAQAAGQIVDGRHIVFRHQHPMFTGERPDALHLERNSSEAWRIGSEIFKRRNPDASHPHVQ